MSTVLEYYCLRIEIISGRKSNSFYNDDHVHNIVGYAWRLWNEGTWLELMDPNIRRFM
ncbi:putative non-specific serine/threonine protein kinase [Rosa chinensis]|uniref:Putative non-specific serine/threonine protein kinase n=1 Tax=Rosa chinensis TaxID=74649 RepID=A0A2P6Q8H1_ROSCH|nr:putative non-specific serine/threonine protein kinase [Rosa chinensis]